jgi:hypothetical protein
MSQKKNFAELFESIFDLCEKISTFDDDTAVAKGIKDVTQMFKFQVTGLIAQKRNMRSKLEKK